MIRIAERRDYYQFLVLAREFHESSPYASFPFSEEKFSRHFSNSLLDPTNFVALVDDHEGNLRGVFAALKTELPQSDTTMTVELMWYVRPEFRKTPSAFRLFKSYEYWSKEVAKADLCQIVALEGITPEHIYEKRGFSKIESTFMKENN